jgi:hypothetical protein
VSGVLFGTLSILATWMVLSAGFIGVGLGIRRLLGPIDLNARQALTAFWMGFSFAILFLQLWHFAFRISWLSEAIILGLGSLGILWNRAALLAAFRTGRFGGRSALRIAVLLGCAIWVANAATAPGIDFDYSVYHLSAVRWTNAYPIVHGLGNLHGRLALNSSYHLYAAMLNVGPWAGESNHLASGLLVAALLIQVMLAAFRLSDAQHDPRPWYSLELGFLAPALFLTMRRGTLASVTTDLPVTVILFVAAAKAFDLAAGLKQDSTHEAYDLLVTATLLTVAACIKLTALAFSIPAGLLTLVVWLSRNRGRQRIVAQTLGAVGVIIFLLAGSWLARGVILSGYPAYPSQILAMPVEWKVPAEQAQAEMAWIRHYGRWYYNPPMQSRGWMKQADGRWVYDPAILDGGWRWFPGWVSNLWRVSEHREGFVFPGVVVLAFFAYFSGRRSHGSSRTLARGWLLLLPTFAAMMLWFAIAPTPRFGFFLPWILAATVVVQALRSLSGIPTVLPLIVIFAIGSVPVAGRIVTHLLSPRSISLTSVLRQLVVAAPDNLWVQPSPTAELSHFATDTGLSLLVPARDQRCWDAPLPCTPQPAVNLALRQKDDLQSGFINTDGQWRQLDFPDPRTYRGRE